MSDLEAQFLHSSYLKVHMRMHLRQQEVSNLLLYSQISMSVLPLIKCILLVEGSFIFCSIIKKWMINIDSFLNICTKG